MGLLDWLRPQMLPPNDPLHDIGGIPLDYFWRRCVEYLPSDWGLMLEGGPVSVAGTGDFKMVYRAIASLLGEGEFRPSVSGLERDTPERALEDLMYRLRDML
jgi:hypothetical protein